ncbi:MAG: tyrosine-type recombinase/integrase [Gemmataceae bacterium]
MTPAQLAQSFYAHLQRLVDAGKRKPATLSYYHSQIDPWLAELGKINADPAQLALHVHTIEDLKPIHLANGSETWHRVQSVQAMFNWAANDLEAIKTSPFKKVKKPPLGQRSRTLSRRDVARILSDTDRGFRLFLVTMRHTIARPGEIRRLQWKHFNAEECVFALSSFKAKERRADKMAVRKIPLDLYMQRLISAMKRNRNPDPDDFIFVNRVGKPFSKDNIVNRMGGICGRLGLNNGEGERIVAYSIRHTSATQASANGIRDRMLAELMGHTNPRTTQRYIHLDTEAMTKAIAAATSRQRPLKAG